MPIKPNKFLLIAFLAISLPSIGQITDSPYSSHGFGLPQQGTFGLNRSIGNTGVGIRSPQFINTLNPASYSSFDLTVFEAGIISQYNEFSVDTSSFSSTSASFAYLGFGVPILPWWGLSFGLQPFTSVGYNYVGTQTEPGLGTFSTSYRGTGGVNKVYVGNGFKYKRLSAGFSANYLFGSINRDRRVAFDPNIIPFNTIAIDTFFVSDFSFDLGAQYVQPLDTIGRNKLTFGATYGLSSNLNTSRQQFIASFSSLDVGDLVRDTIAFESSTGSFVLPENFGAGISFTRGERWLIAADWKHSRWADHSAFGRNDSLANSTEFSFGFQFSPEEDPARAAQVYHRIVQYRAGFRFNQSHIMVRNTQIQEYGITIGVGLPLRRTRAPQMGITRPSVINIGIEAGQRGALAEGLLRERYIRLNLGLTINDRWFIKRRYD
ncbi:MAG: hypothetical protein H0X62_04435 [Bacteroidetes bacterium]|nr:hypothetical protein [Bacteroidota bacterium]